MAYFYNTFEGGVDGQNITVANSGGASGNAWSYIFVNGASTPAGGAVLKYAASAARAGALGCAAASGYTSSYLRWDNASGGSRGVIRAPVRFDSGIPVGTVLSIALIYNSTATMSGIAVRGTGTAYRIVVRNATGADITPSQWTAAINTLYWVEVAATKGTTTSDGTIELKVYAADGTTELWSWSSSTENTGTANVYQGRFMANNTYDWAFDDVQFDSDKPSGWLGPVSSPSIPTANPGPHQAVLPGSTVHLNGGGSTNTTGYSWSFLWPSSGAPSLTGASTATPSFTAGSVGSIYALQLNASNGSETDTATVNIAVVSSVDGSNDLVWTGTSWV